ncbi:MAG: elongation factor Ts [Chloroflexi bacterium]|nr:elongation factor Ts [Chloroflexota bacterium]|tara:strand:+ start:981 stop:1487 length:507 start_codon:yes stop_codon:yes gene_type:complete
MEITAEMVKKLRMKTGAGIMASKKALEDSNGDFSKAEQVLQEQGLALAAKKAGRDTSEGVVQSYIHTGGRIGALVEVKCETDFVARTKEFLDLSKNLAMQIAAMNPVYVDRNNVPDDEKDDFSSEKILLEQAFIRDQSLTVEDIIKEVVSKVGENIIISKFQRFDLSS